jgi:hypothetical protein
VAVQPRSISAQAVPVLEADHHHVMWNARRTAVR